MSPKQPKITEYGMFVYDIPTKEAKQSGMAGEVPSALRKFAAPIQKSVWLFNPANLADIHEVASYYFKPDSGVKSEIIMFTPKDPEQMRRKALEAISELVGHASASLRKSIDGLMKKIDEGQADAKDADAKVKVFYREAKKKMEDAATAAVSFALSEDITEALESATKIVEAMTEKAKAEVPGRFVKAIAHK